MTTKLIFCIVIIGLVIAPLTLQERNWVEESQITPTIFNGATFFETGNSDWIDATQWLREHTPSDSIIFSWWDWGYYIQTLGERTTLADNSTLIDWQIEKIARTFMSSPDDAWVILNSSAETNVPEYYVSLPEEFQKGIDYTTLEAVNEKGEKYSPEITGL